MYPIMVFAVVCASRALAASWWRCPECNPPGPSPWERREWRRAAGEIRPLTGVRGVAASVVMLYHYFLDNHDFSVRIGRQYLAVDLFFVLSGFVMALSYGHLFGGRVSPATYGGFLIKRLWVGFYPLLVVVTAVALVKYLLDFSGSARLAYPGLAARSRGRPPDGPGLGIGLHQHAGCDVVDQHGVLRLSDLSAAHLRFHEPEGLPLCPAGRRQRPGHPALRHPLTAREGPSTSRAATACFPSSAA